MEEINDSIVIKSAETDEELCGRGYVHCTAWQDVSIVRMIKKRE